MTTDRELLERAARAYWGDEIDDVCSIRWIEEDQCIGYTHGDNQDHNGIDLELLWNPLTDDGDALRLAVKLGIYTKYFPAICDETTTYPAFIEARRVDDSDPLYTEFLAASHDKLSATRNAIVRAAAAMAPEEAE